MKHLKRFFIWLQWNHITTELLMEGRKESELMPFEEYYQTKTK